MNHSETLDKIGPAMAAAQAQFGAVSKSGANTYDKYDYAKLEDYVDVVQSVMAEHGLSLIVSVTEQSQLEVRATKAGGQEFLVGVALTGMILHTSGQWIEVAGQGQGQDRGDKGIYKAITGARKYLLASAFGLKTGDDPENDTRRPPESAPAAIQPTGAPSQGDDFDFG